MSGLKRSAARIWNEGWDDYREVYKGEEIIIPGKKHGEGKNFKFFDEYLTAVKFRGQFIEPKYDNNGKPVRIKPLKLEKIEGSVDKTRNQFISHLDGKAFATEAEMKLHLESMGDVSHLQVKDEKREEALKQSMGPQLQDVLGSIVNKLAEIEQRLLVTEAKPKRGRSSKKVDHDTEQHI